MTGPHLNPGTYLCDVRCPQCHQPAVVLVSLRVTLTVPDDDVATLRIRSKSKATDHQCGQTTVAFDRATGEMLLPGDADA